MRYATRVINLVSGGALTAWVKPMQRQHTISKRLDAMTPDHNARTVQHFETVQGRAEQERRNADRAYRNWRIALVFCAALRALEQGVK